MKKICYYLLLNPNTISSPSPNSALDSIVELLKVYFPWLDISKTGLDSWKIAIFIPESSCNLRILKVIKTILFLNPEILGFILTYYSFKFTFFIS